MAAIVRAGSGYKASSASGAQVIDGSLKFDKAKEQYLTRTPGSDGDKETFTWSVWVKRDVFGTEGSADADHNPVFCAGNSGSASTDWRFQNSSSSNDDEFWWINWDGGSTYFSVESTPRYKDVGGFYHIVGTYDEGKATVYINGTPVTALNSNTQNGGTSKINSTSAHSIGCFGQGTLSWFGGNMSQFYLLDGLSVGPSYFGYTDQLTNVWRPKKFLAEGTTVNNGTVWSSTADTPDSGSAADFFDGDLTDTAYWTSVATDHTLTTGPFTINNSLRVYGNLNPNNNRFKINGLYTPYLTPDLGSSWYVIPLTQHTLPITVTSLQQNFASASGISIAAIEVDGVIMKDSTTQNLAYGTNGCYLPFDGNTPIGQDRSGKGNDWTPVNFACSAPLNQATGALPILDTVSGGKVATSGVRTDTYSNSCVFALPLVGIATDVSNRVNSGSTAKVVTTSGAVASSVYSNFYGGSYYFDESNDYITTPDSTEFDFGTGDFTVELWIYLDDQSSSNPVIVGAVGGWYIQLKSSDTQIEFYTGSTSINTGTIPTIKTGIWHHIAACRTGSTIQIFLDGEEVTSASNSDTTDLAAALYVGSYGGASLFFGGYIQDVRVYKGVGKYTSSFVAASTNPAILPDTPSGVSQSSKLTKVTAGALSFSGNSGGANGDHLNLVSTSDFDFGTGDFTIELWANCGGYGSSPYLFDFRTDGSDTGTTNKVVWYVPSSSGKPTFWTNGSSRIVADNIIALDSWVHLALVRSSGTTKMYINGSVQSSTYSDTTDYGDGGSPLIIGQREGTTSQSWPGFISNVRVVKGTAVYTSNFTPSTSPLTNVTNTKLLCCQSSSSATAYTVSPGAITANGNAKASNYGPFNIGTEYALGRSNAYCTMDQDDTTAIIQNGGLYMVEKGGWTNSHARGTMAFPKGKWYYEAVKGVDGGGDIAQFGFANKSASLTETYGSVPNNSWTFYWGNGREIICPAARQGSYFGSGTMTLPVGGAVGFAIDMDNNTWQCFREGIGGAVLTFADTDNGSTDNIRELYPYAGVYNRSLHLNFGQRPFKFPPPEGFQPLCSAGMDSPTFTRPESKYFSPVLYTGTGASLKVGLGFQPDMVWTKQRNEQRSWGCFDSVRGVNKCIRVDGSIAEYTTGGGLDAFRYDGFEVGSNTVVGKSGGTYVGYAYKAGGNKNTFNVDDVGYSTAAAAGMDGGDITPTGCSVGTRQGFSIIKYSGNSTNNQTLSHGLGRVPTFCMVKNLTEDNYWIAKSVYNSSQDVLYPNHYEEEGPATGSQHGIVDDFSSSTTVNLKTNATNYLNVNQSGDDYIMYIWADVPGIQKFGGYEGTNAKRSIWTGFRPALLVIKFMDGTDVGSHGGWKVIDNKRNTYNSGNTAKKVEWNSDLAENAGGDISTTEGDIWFFSSGFEISDNHAPFNTAGRKYIYMAWADQPQHNLYGGQANGR